jgi:hypothetical protein
MGEGMGKRNEGMFSYLTTKKRKGFVILIIGYVKE